MAIYSLADLRNAVPQEMKGMGDDALIRDYSQRIGKSFEETANYLGFAPRGTFSEMGRQALGGAVVDLPKMVGQGLQYTNLAPEYGREMAQAAEARAPEYAPDMRGRGLLGQAGVLGARGLAPVLATAPLAFVPGGQFAAPLAAATLFGTSSAQETYDKILAQTGDEQAATDAARRVGLIQGPLEGAATAVGLRAFKPLATALRGAPRTTAGVAGALTDTAVARPFLKGMGINLAVQPGTEVAQDVGSSLVERAYGAAPEDLGEMAKQSALGGVGLTLLLGPLAGGAAVSRARRAESLKDALYGENTPVETRAKAMDLVMGEARRQGVADQDVDAWFNEQLRLEDARTDALRAAEQEAKIKQIDLLGEEAQQLEGLQGGAFSSLEQQKAFEQGMAGVQMQAPFSSIEQQRAFEQGLVTMRDQNVARVGQQYQDLMGGRASTLMQAQDIGQQAQEIMAPQTRGLAAAEQAGEEYQQIRAAKSRTMMDIEDMGQEWQKLSQTLPQPISGELSSAQKAALRGPSGKRLKATSSKVSFPEAGGPAATSLLQPPQFPSRVPTSTPAPSSLLSERPVEAEPVTPVGETTAVAAALPAVPVAAGVSSTPATTGAPLGTQAPKAIKAKTQREKAPAAPAAAVTTPAPAAAPAAAAPAAAPAAPAAAVEETTTQTVSDAIKEDNEIDRVLKAVEAEDTKTDKLFASVQGGVGKAPGRPSLPTQVYAAIRNAIINPKSAVYVRKAKSIQKDTEATKKYGEKVKAIAEAAREFAAAYETYASQNLVRSGEVIKRGKTADDVIASRATALSTRAAAVRDALAKLGEAVGGNAKDVEAIVRFVKDRAQKEKKGDAKTENADITLSRAWTAAKSESFIGEPDLLATTSAEVRQSREATLKGATPQLVDAANNGYATFGKGPEQTGLNGILNYIRTVGTPFEKILAQAIKLSVAGKAPIKIKFVKEGKSQYDPKTNTITINETSSKEVALHEALHGALQWFVYTNPNATQVVALKTALQRVVNYNGKLPPKAAEVQAVLKKILAGKSKTAELDAVLELVSYGNTLNDFRRALQGMESDAPRTFTKFANDVMDAIYALVRRMLGSSQTVASDVMENTFQLLEAARTATQETAPKKGNVLQVAAPAAPVTPAIVATQVASLPATQVSRLEKHYGSKKGTAEFLAKVQEDIVTYVNKGAQAVAGAIRSIIKTMAEGVLAVGVILNPAGFSNNFDFNLPQTYKTTVTTQVKAEVPANAKAKMSTLAQSVYESMAPTAKASGKGFIVADKPNGMMHVFKADGSMLVQDSALYGKDIGDVESKVSSLKGGAKITPAGKFTLTATPDSEYAGGMVLELAETASEGNGVIAVHAAYLGDASEKRDQRLATPGAGDNRISYGCVNTTHDTFLKSILPNIDTLNGGMIFVLPDAQTATAAMFPATTATTVFEGTEKEATSGDATRNIARKQEGRVEPFGDNVAADSTFDPASGSVLEAAVESGKPISDAKAAAALSVPEVDYTRFAEKNAVNVLSTQRLFEAVGWSQDNAEKLGEKLAKWGRDVAKKFPSTEIMAGLLNSRYHGNRDVSNIQDNYKFDKNVGYQVAERIANYITSQPAAQVNAVFAYLDGNKVALDGVNDGGKLKGLADNMKKWFDLYVSELSPVEQQFFRTRKFSENLLFPSKTEEVARNQFGLGKINEVLGKKSIYEANIEDNWFRKTADGDVILDGNFYQVYKTTGTLKDTKETAGFMSADRFAELGSKDPLGYAVDTTRKWIMEKKDVDKGKYKFTTNTTAREKIADEKADDLANALRNTMAALANNYASKNFISAMAKMGSEDSPATRVAFDSVAQINKEYGIKVQDDQVLKVSMEMARSEKTKDLYRMSGTWVQLPKSDVYGDLSEKFIPGPVWNSMIDMFDRQPLIPVRAINTTMRWFKKSKTTLNFGTHVTNAASNVTMAMMHDISFKTMRNATSLLFRYEVRPRSLNTAERQMVEAFINSGAMLGDFSSAEVKEALYQAHENNLRGGNDDSLATRVAGWLGIEKSKAESIGKIVEKGKAAGLKADDVMSQIYAFEDNAFRMAAFMKKTGERQMDKGLKAPNDEIFREAGKFALKAFGDYDIDSKAVKALRQTVMPFISWGYAMGPVIGRIALTQPWRIANILMAYYLLEAAMSSSAGDDDEETRQSGPAYVRERMFFGSVGPYMHIRIPFMGDAENPVYYKLGDYFPVASMTKGLPNGFMGQSWFPSMITPSGPFVSAILGFVAGVDPYTGKSINQPTDTQWEKLWNSTKFGYDIIAPPSISSRQISRANDFFEGKTGITGSEPSGMVFARAFGLKLYDYNVIESETIQEIAAKRVQREFKTAMEKAKRDEYRKGSPDYDELDRTLEALQERMEKEIDKARGEE